MNPSAVSSMHHSASPTGPVAASAGTDDLIRVFNTALVATQASQARDFSNEIFELMENPAFRAILGAVRQHARLQGLSERQAAEQIITTFRKMDRVWGEYVFSEGVERLKG